MSSTDIATTNPRSERPIRVLCVDDDCDFLELVADFIARENPEIDVVATASTEEGLAAVAGGVDCVVSDYEMPDCDGLEFLRTVRDVDPTVPFVLFTGRGSEEIAAEAISVGVNDYLQKSVGTEQYTLLVNRVTNLVEKHRAERQLAATTERYELLGRASADAFWDWDRETGRAWRGTGFVSTFGYDPSAVGGDREWWETRIHPDDVERVVDCFEQFLTSGDRTCELTYRFRRGDGTYAHIVDRALAVRGESSERSTDGQPGESVPQRVVGAITDVTELVERETELERSQRLYQTLVDSFPDGGVFLFDADLRYTIAGGEALDRHGLSPGEFVGKRFEDVVSPAVAESQGSRYRATIDGVRQRWSEVYDGREYHVETVPVRDENGVVFAGMLVALDVTDQRRNEAELHRQNERLERFASVLSHDLRNPLTVAMARLELAREEVDSTHLDSVADAHERMRELLESVLALARSGHIGTTSPAELADVANIHWAHVDTAEATLDVVSNLTFEADRSRLGQLFENAFANAVRHGGPDVTVRVGALDDGDGFFVEDDGPGIPAESRRSALEVGYSTQPQGGGFGLGIIVDVAAGHGWTVDLSDGDDGGLRIDVRGVEPH